MALAKRGVQLAAYFSKSSSSTLISISRSLAGSSNVANNRVIVRGYASDQKEEEHHISALQLEFEKLMKTNVESVVRMQFEIEKLRSSFDKVLAAKVVAQEDCLQRLNRRKWMLFIVPVGGFIITTGWTHFVFSYV